MNWGVHCDWNPLTDVLVSTPEHYVWLPNCAVARHTMDSGGQLDRQQALSQHEALRQRLASLGARVHAVPPSADLPDLSFTRDTTAMTPWGLLSCRMSEAERSAEVRYVEDYVCSLGVPLWHRTRAGSLEGGDICMLRPGLVVIGVGGDRTSMEGAMEASDAFAAEGWEVRRYRYDAYFLHLDTFFCLAAQDLALACTDIIEDEFLDWLGRIGITLIPISFKEMRRLGANILALGDGQVLSSSQNRRANAAMAEHGLRVHEVDVSQFALGGGGIHCLTMPLARAHA